MEEDIKTCKRPRRVDFLGVLLLTTHDLSELSSYTTDIITDSQNPERGNKSSYSKKISGHWLWFSALGAILLQRAA